MPAQSSLFADNSLLIELAYALRELGDAAVARELQEDGSEARLFDAIMRAKDVLAKVEGEVASTVSRTAPCVLSLNKNNTPEN